MKYFGGCDVGSTYTKCVILDENGKIVATVTNRSKINPVQSAQIALDDAVSQVEGLITQKNLHILSVQATTEIRCRLLMRIFLKSAVTLWVCM